MGRPSKKLDESGLISILITSMLMIVVSLIVLGFAQVANREQRQSLDTQLSTQAYYAAETGINDVQDIIRGATGPITSDAYDKSTCDNPNSSSSHDTYASLYDSNKYILSSTDNVEYSCLLVQTAPNDLVQDVNSATVFKIDTRTGSRPDTIQFDWHAEALATGACPTTAKSFAKLGAWTCPLGVARIDLVPIYKQNQSQDDLAAQTMTVFAEPTTVNGSSPVPYTANGLNTDVDSYAVHSATCNVVSTYNCTLKIDVHSLPPGLTSYYYARITPLYKPLIGFTITAYNSGNKLPLAGQQAMIDVTGKAQDVLRRIQVRIDISNVNKYAKAEAPLESNESICKRFVTAPGYVWVPDPGLAAPGDTSDNPWCTPRAGVGTPAVAVAPVPLASIGGGGCGGAGQPVCPGPPVGGSYHYSLTLTNNSNNPPSEITSCSWNWGDGSPVQTLPGTDPSCQYKGISPLHTYPKINPEPAYPTACPNVAGAGMYMKVYTVTLTVTMGGNSATDTRPISMPNCY